MLVVAVWPVDFRMRSISGKLERNYSGGSWWHYREGFDGLVRVRDVRVSKVNR